MVRTQIQLTERQVQAVKKLAAERDVSIAEVIRQAIDRFLQTVNSDEADWEEKRQRALLAVGMFHSGLSDISENHDEYFAQAIEDYPKISLRPEPAGQPENVQAEKAQADKVVVAA